MVEQKDRSEKVKDPLSIISLLIIGLGVGWLAGLSVSPDARPVAPILISALLGVAIAFIGIISISLKFKDSGGVKKKVGFKVAEKISIDSFAWIVLGIVVGVNVGICMRTHNLLGVNTESALNRLGQELNELHGHYDNKKWAELGIDKKEVAQRILDQYYPKGGVVKISADTDSGEKMSYSSGVLRNSTSTDCNQLQSRQASRKREYIEQRLEMLPEFVPLLKMSDEELEQEINKKCNQLSESTK